MRNEFEAWRGRGRIRLLRSAALVLSCFMLAGAFASAYSQQAGSTVSTLSEQDLAKSIHNPFEDFVKVPIQAVTGFNVGTNHSAGEAVNMQPLFPFALTR